MAYFEPVIPFMNILFYFRTHFDDPANTGVIQKCRSMVAAFESCGDQCDTYFFSKNGLEKSGNATTVFPWSNTKRSAKHLALFYYLADQWMIQHIDFQQYSHFIIRHFPTHPFFIQLLKTAKKQHPDLKIILELPTWPYDKEPRGIWANGVALLDRFYRKSLHQYFDVVLHHGTDKMVLQIPTISVSNGIDLQNIPVRAIAPVCTNELRLIAVGHWNVWHGLDRVLAGMDRYRQSGGTTPIHLTIVGDGPVIPHLQQLVIQLGMEQQVIFIPPCTGKTLADLFDRSHVAVGVLGLHRKDLTVAAPLKHRDYCARGIPFLLAGADLDFDSQWPYLLHVPENDTPVDMAMVISFVRSLPTGYVSAMRDFAEKELGWETKVGRIRSRL
jgi:glycosyltransferase involved in cell wall biosynthesis